MQFVRGGLGFLLAPFAGRVIGESDQHMSLLLGRPRFPTEVLVSFAHVKCQLAERERLWEGLLPDKPRQGPWYVVRDFNLILSANEKRGGRHFQPAEELKLSRFIYNGEVFDAGFTSPTFT